MVRDMVSEGADATCVRALAERLADADLEEIKDKMFLPANPRYLTSYFKGAF